MSLPGQLQVGELYLGFNRNGLPVWRQPGGIGTTVYPQVPTAFPWFGGANAESVADAGLYQWPGAYSAQYFFLCGHPLNCPEVYSYYDPYAEEVMAVITCPLCSLIQILMPYTQYQSEIDTPLVVA